MELSEQLSEPRAHTGATKGLLTFLRLLCFPSRRFSSQDRRPQNGSASTGKLHYSNVRCGNRSNLIASLAIWLVSFVNLSVLCGFRSSVRKFRRIPWRNASMLKRFLTVSVCLLALI